MKVTIYCLIDPETIKVRYIGRTTKLRLSDRLAEHISKTKYKSKYQPGTKFNHKDNWIISILNKGLKPIIKYLTVVEGWKESHEFERNLICKYKNRLVNSDDKGEGHKNKIVTQEQRIKISNSLKKNLCSWLY